MSRDKDFVSIDQLFSNLKDGITERYTDNWASMKAKLDKEMPDEQTIFYAGKPNNKKWLIAMLVVVIAGGIGLTTWQMYNSDLQSNAISFAFNDTQEENEMLAQNGMNTIKESLSSGTKAILANFQEQLDQADKSKGENLLSEDRKNKIQAEKLKQPKAQSTSGNNIVESSSKLNNSFTEDKNFNRLYTDNQLFDENKKAFLNADSVNSEIVKSSNEVMYEQGDNNREDVPPSTHITSSLESSLSSNNETEALIGHKEINNSPVVFEQMIAAGDATFPTSLHDKKIAKTADDNWYKEIKDSVTVLRSVMRTANMNQPNTPRRTDTVGIFREEWIKNIPLDPVELMSVQQMEINNHIVAAAIHNKSSRLNNLTTWVPLSNYQVKTKRLKNNSFNNIAANSINSLSAFFDGTRNIYAAAYFGGNYSLHQPGAFGMHLGIATLYSIAERWTLSAELRYQGNYFNNYIIQDKSYTYDVQRETVGGGNYRYYGTEQVENNRYKINNFNTLNMPLMLHYSLGRVSLSGGLNVYYGMKVKYQKMPNVIHVNSVEQVVQSGQSPFNNSPFNLNSQQDFLPRMGLGYTAGINFDVNKNISIEAKMTQNLWNNLSGFASNNILDKMYKAPSLQLSIGYYLGRKDKVVYIMDRK